MHPLKSHELECTGNTVSIKLLAGILKQHRLALLIRQAAEWSMGAMQKMCA